jgi:choline-sulfatase
MSSVLDAGPCVRTNQLDFDDEVVFTVRQKLFDLARARDDRPFCLVMSLTHPHDPFAIPDEYWSLYREDDIDLPRVALAPDRLDPHSRRLRQVCDMDRTPLTERHIRRARRAYYGAVSYVDEQIGRVLEALERCGLADDTIIVLLADHGEMLGERGLWYKMSFFEGASRIPLIVHAPRRFGPRRVAASVSLVDILPTLVDLAGASAAVATPLDGRSLLPHLAGTGGHDEAIGEYLAEGALAPIVMIRRGRHKFIHSPADPDQLYDLEQDPDELENRAANPVAKAFRNEVATRWNLPDLHRQVLASQRRRRFVAEALRHGRQHSWDHQPVQDASRRFMRNHLELDDLEAMARFPRVDPA